MPPLRASVACVLLSACSAVLSHGGGLNAEGCHTNRKTGEYHCHRAPSIAPPAQADSSESNKDSKKPAGTSVPAVPTCHVGPRGGTYTITKSGRKNYGGC